jgi:aminopeptidase-like protein
MPETIGSSIFVANNLSLIDQIIGGVFSEMGGADSGLQIAFSRRKNTYVDRAFKHVMKLESKNFKSVEFRKGWGNDELVFDSPGVGVPIVSLDRFPFEAYHTNLDNMDLVNEEKLEECVNLLLKVVDLLELDYIPVPANRVPVYLTRFNLYSDWTTEREDYDVKSIVLDNLWSGLSILDISLRFNLNFERVHRFTETLFMNGLISKKVIDPTYSRQVFQEFE